MKTYQVKFEGKSYQCRENENLLDAFIRQGVELPFSCRKGSCHACLMHCVEGSIPASAQHGIRQEYISSRYFLPCSCNPVDDITVDLIPREELITSGVVSEKEYLSENICRLRIEPSKSMDFRAGQFIVLMREDGLSRSYSLAGLPEDYYLELHIKRMRNGVFSNWIFDCLQVGDCIDMQGPYGDCFYHDNQNPDDDLVLIGKSSGLAPLIGILKDAIARRHRGDVYVYHFVDDWRDVYYGKTLKQLSIQYSNVYFHQGCYGCSKDAELKSGEVIEGLARKIAAAKTMFYMAGSPAWLESINQKLIEQNIPEHRIYTDPYDFNDLRSKKTKRQDFARRINDVGYSGDGSSEAGNEVIEGIWGALDQGKRLMAILQEFYGRVYEDDRLSPFFHNTTKQRSIEKQFLFLRQKFTGEKVYFGDRPRNAHHWMVITDEIFDYRKSILQDCMIKHELDQNYINDWLDMEESFRKDIVKEEPWPKVINGVEMPLNGYEVMQIDVGSICDGCQGEIHSGQTVRYHVRLGLTYCQQCMGQEGS